MSLFNKWHLYATYLILIVLTTLFYWPILILIFYHVKVKHLIKYKIILAIFLMIIGSFIIHTYNEDSLESEVIIVEKKQNLYNKTYLVKKGFKLYELTIKDDFKIGDRLYINGQIKQFRSDTVLFGFNEKHYKINHGIYGKIAVKQLKYIKSSFHINQIKSNISHLNIPFLNYIFTNEFIPKDFQLSYLFGISTMTCLGVLKILKYLFFHFNINLLLQESIIIIIFFVLYYLSGHLTVLFFLLMLILDFTDKVTKFKMTHLDKLSIRLILMIVINPYIVFHQGFIIINLFSFFYQLIPMKEKDSYMLSIWMILPFNILWNQEINILLLLIGPLLFKVVKKYVIYIVIVVSIMPYLSIYQTLIQFLTMSEFYIDKLSIVIHTHSLSSHFMIVYYIGILLLYGYNFKYREMIVGWILLLTQMLYVLLRPDFVYFLDVGQGDSAIIYFQGQVMVVDAYEHVEITLRHLNLRTIDHLILTHSDLDHTKESVNLINNFNVKNIYLNDENNYNIDAKNTHYINKDNLIEIEHFNLKFLSPMKSYETKNDYSLVFKMNLNGVKYLFTGDISRRVEKDLIESYDDLRVDVIKVSHHGSNDSSSREMIAATNPKYAVISSGEDNRYNHPHQQTLDNYYYYGTLIQQTKVNGSILHIIRKNKIDIYMLNKPYTYW